MWAGKEEDVCLVSTTSMSFRGSEVADYPLLNELILTPREVLSSRALNKKLNEIEKQEQKDREKLASRNEKLRNKLKSTEERTPILEGDVQEKKTGHEA